MAVPSLLQGSTSTEYQGTKLTCAHRILCRFMQLSLQAGAATVPYQKREALFPPALPTPGPIFSPIYSSFSLPGVACFFFLHHHKP
jgi:hypothetical protein